VKQNTQDIFLHVVWTAWELERLTNLILARFHYFECGGSIDVWKTIDNSKDPISHSFQDRAILSERVVAFY
jgi:hypothetical protein